MRIIFLYLQCENQNDNAMKKEYTTDEIKAIVDGEPANDAPVEEVGRYYYDEIDHEEKFRPYTMEEINAMIDRAEADIAAGRGIPDEEVWREFEEELAREEEYELAEAV